MQKASVYLENSTEKNVLGLTWNCHTEVKPKLTTLGESRFTVELTNRNTLSVMAFMFDLFGLVGPVSVSMTILFQEMCRRSKLGIQRSLVRKLKVIDMVRRVVQN